MLFSVNAAVLFCFSPPSPTVLVAATRTQQPAPAARKVTSVRTRRCDTPRPFDFPAQRLDETAQAIAHATGCFIKFSDPSIASV